jgi:hypothetical protein
MWQWADELQPQPTFQILESGIGSQIVEPAIDAGSDHCSRAFSYALSNQ